MLTVNRRLAAAAALAMALPGLATAQEAGSGRYAFVPAPEGTLRLDTKTGTVSLCGGEGAALACRPLREDAGTAAAMRDLETRLAEIEDRLARIEAAQEPAGDAEPGDEGAGDAEAGLPTLKDEEAVDRVMDLAERMMRRFFDMVEDFRDESEAQRI